jgi:hypothetical protein
MFWSNGFLLILHPTSASTITTIFELVPSGVLKH